MAASRSRCRRATARRPIAGKQSQIAITSRWKCIVPFALPVVPDVNAMSTVSSAAVSQFANVAGFADHHGLERAGIVGREVNRPSARASAAGARLLHGRLALGREPRVA